MKISAETDLGTNPNNVLKMETGRFLDRGNVEGNIGRKTETSLMI